MSLVTLAPPTNPVEPVAAVAAGNVKDGDNYEAALEEAGRALNNYVEMK